MSDDQGHGDWQLSIGTEPGPNEAEAKAAKSVTAVDPAATPGTASGSKKTVLLVDINSRTRDSRAKIMRTLGAVVHCVSSADAAISTFVPGSYNLVLIDLGRDVAGAEHLADEFRARNPRQLVAFLIGSPLFVATSLRGKTARPARVSPPQTAPPLQPTTPPVLGRVAGFDFGQKIRDAEAEKLL
jgi:CheY-like chemotaxis protein